MRISLIMAGGKGERLWPLSRNNRPKQFLKLINDRTLLERTYERACNISGKENCYIVAGEGQKDTISDILPDFNIQNYISEPIGKNTAPCVALSIAHLRNRYNISDTVIIMPSDHYIEDDDVFIKSTEILMDFSSKSDYICTFGIRPSSIQTGYGHIILDRKQLLDDKNKIYRIKKFVEKPDEKTIKKIIKENKEIHWNSGMFIFSINTITSAFEKYMPSLWNKVNSAFSKNGVLNKNNIKHVFQHLSDDEATSIDYGIMNKADKVCVMEVNFGWDDIGSFEAIKRILSDKIDKNGNLTSGKVVNLNSEGSIFLERGTPIIAHGVKDMYIITTCDVVLIIPKGESQKVKDIVREIEKRSRAGEDWLKKLL
ncbi:MAG: mannose-1-phosphate guanylyltransferase [bacterium]